VATALRRHPALPAPTADRIARPRPLQFDPSRLPVHQGAGDVVFQDAFMDGFRLALLFGSLVLATAAFVAGSSSLTSAEA